MFHRLTLNLIICFFLPACALDPISLNQPKENNPGDSGLHIDKYATLSDINKAQAYGQNILPVLNAHCGSCHGVAREPLFAVSNDTLNAFKAGDPYINFNNPIESRFYKRSKLEKHNCEPDCDNVAERVLEALQGFQQSLNN